MTKKEREELMLKKLFEMKKFEKELHDQGVGYIGGVDEVGRGPLAGPVVAACVVLPADLDSDTVMSVHRGSWPSAQRKA